MIGVVGVDVLTGDLSEKFYDTEEILKAIISNSAKTCAVNTMDICDMEDLRSDAGKCFNTDGECTGDAETLIDCANVVTGHPNCGGGQAPPSNVCCGSCGESGLTLSFSMILLCLSFIAIVTTLW